jgi:hypothetical protein
MYVTGKSFLACCLSLSSGAVEGFLVKWITVSLYSIDVNFTKECGYMNLLRVLLEYHMIFYKIIFFRISMVCFEKEFNTEKPNRQGI